MILLLLLAATPGSVVNTRHNLSSSGPGPVRSVAETEVCVFCHAAHTPDATEALWNHETSSQVQYQPYQSPTLGTRPGQPDGASILCLSCHDGTIAVGALRNRAEPVQMHGTEQGGRLRADAASNLGLDLSGTHPISVAYDDALSGQQPGTALRLRSLGGESTGYLDKAGRVQCTSCHDPHVDPAAEGAELPPFWRGDSHQEVCQTCHVAPLVEPAHADPRLLPLGCGSCHVGHGLGGERLLEAREEDACYACHGGAEAARAATTAGRMSREARPTLVEPLFDLPSHHPVSESRWEHEAGEELETAGANAPRHVECVDCHAVHGTERPKVEDALRPGGRRGLAILGSAAEFEVCYQCHGENANLPYGETDKRAEFDPTNQSYHPVELPAGRRSPSLRSPWQSGDMLRCTDCHSAEEGSPSGPHGSDNDWILRLPYTVRDGADEGERSYALCYDCHSRAVLLRDESFAGHSQHVVSEKISCYACHDSHGSPDAPGLVRFGKDARYDSVRPSSTGQLAYEAETGRCWVSCHGRDHDGEAYGR